MIGEEYLYERNFYILFQDAVQFLNDSDSALAKEDYYGMERFARASIINSTLILECSANCCLDTLNITNSFKKDLDKLPVLSKFEFYLSYKYKERIFDRGCNEIQNVAELKTIRDLIVHPKVQRTKWERIDEFRSKANFGATIKLKLPMTIEEFHRNDALICLRVLCSVLDHLFTNLCCYSSEITKNILICSFAFKEDSSTGVGTPEHWAEDQKKWSLRLGFIGLESKNAKTI